MRPHARSLLATAAAVTLLAGGCTSSNGGGRTSGGTGSGGTTPAAATSSSPATVGGGGARVGIILPDTGDRWDAADPVALTRECTAADLVCDVQNAMGSATALRTIAARMIPRVKVLVFVPLDTASALAIEEQARAKGVLTVDYDRFAQDGASLLVSFDHTLVGTTEGQAMVRCPQVANRTAVTWAQVDGPVGDAVATQLRTGYDSVLSRTPNWTRVAAASGLSRAATATSVFRAILSRNPTVQAVVTADDVTAGGVVTALEDAGRNGRVAVGGQGASVPALRRILAGDQCFTVFQPSTALAHATIAAVVELVAGRPVSTTGTVTGSSGMTTPVLLVRSAQAITAANVGQVITDGYVTRSAVCGKGFETLCSKAGI